LFTFGTPTFERETRTKVKRKSVTAFNGQDIDSPLRGSIDATSGYFETAIKARNILTPSASAAPVHHSKTVFGTKKNSAALATEERAHFADSNQKTG